MDAGVRGVVGSTPMFIAVFITVFLGTTLVLVLKMAPPEHPPHKLALKKASATAIAEFREGGEAKLLGRIRAISSPLQAPLTGRDCVCYYAQVAGSATQAVPGAAQPSSPAAHYPDVQIHDIDGQDFIIEDETGRALVRYPGKAPIRTKGWEPALEFDTHLRSGTFSPPSPELKAFMERHGHSAEECNLRPSLHYREAVLREGDEVVVSGPGSFEADPEPSTAGYRDSASRLVIEATNLEPIYLTNHPRQIRRAKAAVSKGQRSL